MPSNKGVMIGGILVAVGVMAYGLYCYVTTPSGGAKEDKDEGPEDGGDDGDGGDQGKQPVLSQPSSGSGLTVNTVDVQIPGYYVIVGRGTAAIVNHSTLRRSAEGQKRLRLKGDEPETLLPVMHIGMEDPWLNYAKHGMGQPPYLLNMPGYQAPVAPDEVDMVRTGCSSKKFSASTEAEWQALLHRYGQSETNGIHCTEGWVAALQSRDQKTDWQNEGGIKALDELAKEKLDRGLLEKGLELDYPKGAPPFRLIVVGCESDGVTQKFSMIYAHKVDFCTGGGRVRTAPREEHPDFEMAKTPPWVPSKKWTKELIDRKIIHGVDGLTEFTPFPKEHRICVYGAGGIGLNQIERAHDLGVAGPCMDWYGREHIGITPTLALRRNDTVLKGHNKAYMDPGDADIGRTSAAVFDANFATIPGNRKWRFGNFSKIRAQVEGEKVHMRVPVPDGKPFLTDAYAVPVLNNGTGGLDYRPEDKQKLGGTGVFAFGENYGLFHMACCATAENGMAYDRVIVCLGQDGNQAGEPARIAWFLTFEAILDAAGYLVGLQAVAGPVRILGAAAVMYPGAVGKTGYTEMEAYRGSLPGSAVLPGFILAGHNIAAANGFFTADRTNKNANTVTMAEMVKLLEVGGQEVGAAIDLAAKLVTRRKWRSNGFASIDQLKEALLDPEIEAVTNSGMGLAYPAAPFL